MSHIQLVSLYYLAHRGCWPILILTQPMARADGYSMARWYCYGICCDTGRHRLFMIPILSAGVESRVRRQHRGGNPSSTMLTMLMKDPVTRPN